MKLKKSTSLYFAYGANMAIESMQFRCPEAVALGAFILRDWRLVFCHHATIQPEKDSVVPGCLWEISNQCEEHLDQFEGFPHYYTKMWLEQDDYSFMAYDMNPPYTYSAPAPSYVDCLQQGYHDWNLPLEHLDEALYYDGR